MTGPTPFDPDAPFAFDPDPGNEDAVAPSPKPAMARPALEAELNPEQRAAVQYPDGPALVVAGAGSGKTRVLVYRVAHLVAAGISPSEILLLTFTRRAAEEMIRRAGALVHRTCDDVAGGTFHSFANQLLRRYGRHLELPPNFTILDQSDSADVIGQVRSALGLGGRERRFPQKQTCLRIISSAINRSLDLSETVLRSWPHFAPLVPDLADLYRGYREFKLTHRLLDYDDLLLFSQALLEENEAVRQQVAEQYRYVLVDEFQDTNRIQGDIVRHLGSVHGNVMVVGDDAQSIYGFRGATVENIFDFPKLFEGTGQVTLNRNYRSSQAILDVANEILSRATRAYPKHLVADRPEGDTPRLIACANEHTQSQWVAQRILELREDGVALGDIAVLFRSSFHAFELEVELGRRDIPYVKYGGYKFTETAHVKDLVSHLRVIANPSDAVAWTRILCLLPGIGAGTASKIIRAIDGPSDLGRARVPKRAADGIERMAALFQRIMRPGVRPAAMTEEVLEYYTPLLLNQYDDGPRRLPDLHQLAALADGHTDLDSLLSDFAIDPPNRSVEGGSLSMGDDEARLVLSTIHSAKGLEWEAVFVIWTLEGRFPSLRAAEGSDEMEEERRLMYVAVTRARQELNLTYPAGIWDRTGLYLSRPSSLLDGIPADILVPHRAIPSGLGLAGEIHLKPLVVSIDSPPTETIIEDEWESSRLRHKAARMDRQVLGHLSSDPDEPRYEIDPDLVDEL